MYITCALLLSGCHSATPKKQLPMPDKGIVDIGDWDFEQSGAISFQGEWAYYLNRLIIHDNLVSDENVTPDGYLRLPSNWKKIKRPDSDQSMIFGAMTLHLRIAGTAKNGEMRRLSIYFPQIRSASAIYVSNDEKMPRLVDSSGKPGITKESHKPWFGDLEAHFASEKVTDIYLEISNFEDANNQGTYGNLYIGTEEQIEELQNNKRQKEFFLMGMISFAGIFMLVFFMLRRSEFAPLWLGLFSLSFVLRIFIIELYAYELTEGILSFQTLLRINYFTVYFICLAYTAFLRSIFPEFFSRRIAIIVYSVCLIFAVLIQLNPPSFYTQFLFPFFVFIFACLIWMLQGQLWALWKRMDMLAVTSLLGSMFIAITGVIDILSRMNFIDLQNTMQIGFSLNIFCMSVIVSIHNSRERNRVERLTRQLSQEIKIRRNAEQEINLLNRQLTDQAEDTTIKLKNVEEELQKTEHKTELADITIGTLHNIKNVLNSIKVSVGILRESWNADFGKGYKKATELLRSKYDSIERFIKEDPKGKILLEYYIKLEKVFDDETKESKKSLFRMLERIKAIEDIIDSQQRYGIHNRFEEINPVLVIEDALNMQMGSIGKRKIRIRRSLKPVPSIKVEKTKLLHVLINLIKNASEAMNETPVNNRLLDLKTEMETDKVKIVVRDRGYGISPENLDKVFTRGFTTKTEGHGFGLNSSLNYVEGMGGTMRVSSDGIDKGATFILEFPLVSDSG
jgi:signal transduction histidine kinase